MKIKRNHSLSTYTTFKVGGKVSFFFMPKNSIDYRKAVILAEKEKLPIYVLGGGANTLFPDNHLDAAVIYTKGFNKIYHDGNRVTIGSGVSVQKAIQYCMFRRLSGMEFAAGLPGSIGGAVYMNARCYGREFADILESVTVINHDLKTIKLSKDEIGYGYKKSVFMDNPDYFIVEAVFNMKKDKYSTIRKTYKNNFNDRKSKGQFKYPSAGCVFKNDYSVGISSGKLIDDCGLKGKRVGDALVYDKHANFIVNSKSASSYDIKKLIGIVADEVYQKKGIKLEKELRVIE